MTYSRMTSPGGADHVIPNDVPAFMAKDCSHSIIRGSVVQIVDVFVHDPKCCDDRYESTVKIAIASRDIIGRPLSTARSGRGEVVMHLPGDRLKNFTPMTESARAVKRAIGNGAPR